MSLTTSLLRPLRTLALLAFAACGGASEPPPSGPSPRPDAGSPEAAAAPSGGAEAGTAAVVYTSEQSQRGRQVFRDRCAECHFSSEMRDDAFQFEWSRRTVGDLLTNVTRTMPDDAPGSLSAAEYVDVIAYILELNGFAAGPSELTSDGPALGASLKAPGGQE